MRETGQEQQREREKLASHSPCTGARCGFICLDDSVRSWPGDAVSSPCTGVADPCFCLPARSSPLLLFVPLLQ